MYQKVEDGKFYHPSYGRIMEHRGYSLRIAWSQTMLDLLRTHFPHTLNEELAGIIGVSVRTMIRKARELGLEKDTEWLRDIHEERRHIAHAVSKCKGYPGSFQKGQHANPKAEFKPGHQLTEEQRARQRESLVQWYKKNTIKAKAKARKAWETRRANLQ